MLICLVKPILYIMKIKIFIILKIFFVFDNINPHILKIFFSFSIKSLLCLILVLLSVAFFTLLERKLLSSIQKRKGPTKVGFLGILQPVADGLKLILKETIIPRNSFLVIFFVSPILSFIFGFILWALLPFSYTSVISDLNYGVLFVFIISIFHVYSIILAGWSSNSKYSFLGSLRSSAQLIAYDISLGFIILTLFLATKTLNLGLIVEFQILNGWLVLYYPILFLIFFVCCLAETNRHPFDLPEAEAELVSGYNVEYSAAGFALFFLGEYSSMLFMSFLTVNLFLGGWYTCGYAFVDLFFYFFKVVFVVYLFIFSRAAIPRYRYDKLMSIGWKFFIPITFSIFVINVCIFYCYGGF